jgi:hypothetical protein
MLQTRRARDISSHPRHGSRKKRNVAKRFEATHKIVAPLTVGTRVLVRDATKTSKHDQNYVGQYHIIEVLPTSTYVLSDDTRQTLVAQ